MALHTSTLHAIANCPSELALPSHPCDTRWSVVHRHIRGSVWQASPLQSPRLPFWQRCHPAPARCVTHTCAFVTTGERVARRWGLPRRHSPPCIRLIVLAAGQGWPAQQAFWNQHVRSACVGAPACLACRPQMPCQRPTNSSPRTPCFTSTPLQPRYISSLQHLKGHLATALQPRVSAPLGVACCCGEGCRHITSSATCRRRPVAAGRFDSASSICMVPAHALSGLSGAGTARRDAPRPRPSTDRPV